MKKLISLLCTLAICLVISMPAIAAGAKPAVEIMDFTMSMNSVGGVSTTLSFRNNSGRPIKYIELTVTAYNRVGDKVADEITGRSSINLRVIGPVEPFTPAIDPNWTVYTSSSAEGTPFSEYKETPYVINNGSRFLKVYLDKYNNFFVKPSYNIDDFIYLTDNEINNAMYFNTEVEFENIMYNSVVDYLVVGNATVTYMDNTKQTISSDDIVSDYRRYSLQNQAFLPIVARYNAVYNYADYKELNPDLIAVLGNNEKLLFEHFITNGMKEGRQGSKEFNLAAYKANNPDLVAAFGEDNVKYYEHYISSGKSEGRKAV